MGMQDTVLWQLLNQAPVDMDAVLPLLEELAPQPMPMRFPFIDALLKLARSQQTRPAIAAIRCLAGAHGYNCLKTLVELFDSAVPEVREEALRAFSQCVRFDISQFTHAMFHSDPDIRRLAIAHSPPALDPSALLLLLPDRENQDLLLEKLAGASLSASSIGSLLAFERQQLIDRDVACKAIMHLPWESEAHHILNSLEGRDLPLDSFDAVSLEQTRTVAQQWVDALPSLRLLIELFWAGKDDMLFGVLWGLVTQGQLKRGWLTAVSAVVAHEGMTTGQWTTVRVALAALALPHVLTLPEVPPRQARQACILHGARQEAPQIEKNLAGIKDCAPFRTRDNRLDLAAIAGILAPGARGFYYRLFELYDLEEIVDSLTRNTRAGMVCLQALDKGKDEKRKRDSIVKALLASSDPPSASLFSLLAVHLHAEALPQMAQQRRMGETWRCRFLVCLLKDHLVDLAGLSQNRQEGLGGRVADTWSMTSSTVAMEQLLDFPNCFEMPFVQSFFTAVARKCPMTLFVSAVKRWSDQQIGNLLALVDNTPGFPPDKHWELVGLMEKRKEARFRRWAKQFEQPPPRTLDIRRRESVRFSRLSEQEAHRIASCPDWDIGSALKVCYDRPIQGLVAALASRTPSEDSNKEVCCALLVCHDSPALTAGCFERFRPARPMRDRERFLAELDSLMAGRCYRMERMPVLGNAWLHRWDERLDELDKQISNAADFHALLVLALSLPSAHLSLQLWEALTHLVKRWRWRDRCRLHDILDKNNGKLLLAVLVSLGPVIQLHDVIVPLDPALRFPAVLLGMKRHSAEMLIRLHRVSVVRDTLNSLALDLEPHLPAVPEECRDTLAEWVDSTGVQDNSQAKEDWRPPDKEQLDKVSQSVDLEFLSACCEQTQSTLVQEAALRLLQLGPAGEERLCDVLLTFPGPPLIRILAQCTSLLESPLANKRLELAVGNPEVAPLTRFLIAMDLVQDGRDDLRSAVLQAVVADDRSGWFTEGDWERMLSAGWSERTMALELAHSQHYQAYRYALSFLTAPSSPDEEMLDALERFILTGTSRYRKHRVMAALKLADHGRWTGYPVLATDTVMGADSAYNELLLAGQLPDSLFESMVRSVLQAGDVAFDERRLLVLLDSVSRRGQPVTAGYQAVLDGAVHVSSLFQASLYLTSHSQREDKYWDLAELFAWGVRIGQQLTGRMFTIGIENADEYGHTVAGEAGIYVNPIPVLRKERNGTAVVRGLILHELGHQVYHADPADQTERQEAHDRGLGGLLNLVADEHLERNLRAQSQQFGNDLKKLNAYAFQHNNRTVNIDDFVTLLGPRAFDVLVSVPLGVARQQGHFIINSGKALLALEASGSSFARFVRALRMGLGNRHNDLKVGQALALFKSNFRGQDMTGLLDMAQELSNIFGREAQAALSIGAGRQSSVEMAIHGGGISQDELQRRIRRILEGGNRGTDGRTSGPDTGGGPHRFLNLGPDIDFKVIDQVRKVPFDPARQRLYARQVARWSRRLRSYLQQLGLALEQEQQRVTGTRLDRTRLQSAILRGDPRLLQARYLRPANDLFLGVLVDCSGSMALDDNLEKARLFATLIAESARGLDGIDARFFGFTDDVLFDAGTDARCAVHALEEQGGNNDAAALWHMATLARASRRSVRLIVMISDGSPTECTVSALRSLVERVTTRMKIVCAQVALRPLDEVCFPHYVDLSAGDVEKTISDFGRMTARLIGKTMSGG